MTCCHRFLPLALTSCLALAAPLSALPLSASAQALVVSVAIAPPPLPVYAQPVIPGPGYLWVPGYWAWGPEGYYWVPGTWVMPPAIGLLWTPGYWAWDDGVYFWHAGYWGPHVGFYGGIDYGFGYPGEGYFGGHWDRDRFFYNRAVTNITNVRITNIYDTPIRESHRTRVSFNGGRGGIDARPTAAEEGWAHERHADQTAAQMRHEHAASGDHALLASVNHGRPAIAATAEPGNFRGGFVGARGPEQASAATAGRPAAHRGQQNRPHAMNERARAQAVHAPRGAAPRFAGAPHRGPTQASAPHRAQIGQLPHAGSHGGQRTAPGNQPADPHHPPHEQGGVQGQDRDHP